ncbi:PAS domain S-box [Pleurocapsa sp. PCC 7327]|nr:PAS domain S-box [Pleurocapsa sp. PCC 7327]
MSAIIPKQMSGLRCKVVSAIGIAFLVLFVGQFTAARIILLNSYAKFNRERAILNAKQVQNVLSHEICQLDLMAGDWAEWDDTYQFVKDGNAAYIASNLVNRTFTNLKLNVFLIVDQSGQIVFGQGFDLQSQKRRALPADLMALIFQDRSPLLRHSRTDGSIKGFVLLQEGLMLLSARSILTSQEQEPVRGTLIMGRFLDRAEIERLAEIMQVKLSLYRDRDPQQPADVQSVRSQLLKNAPVAAKNLTNNAIASYVLLRDIFARPASIVRIEIDRNTHVHAESSFLYYFWTTLVIGLVFCGLSWLLLERLILSRLGQLTHLIDRIGATGNLSARVLLAGNDELSQLASALNSTLEQLQQSQIALKESEERYFLVVEGANHGMWDWDLLTDQIYFSPRWKAILGYEDNEIDPDPNEWFERVHPQERESIEWGIEIHLNGQTPYFQYEYRMRHKDGSYRWVLCRGLAVRDEQGKPYRMAGSLSDITERKLAERALAQQAVELARSNAELEQFAYIASHDLQEPLRKIEAFGDRLQANYTDQLGDRGRDYLERIRKSAQRLRILIQDLLTFSCVTTTAQPFVSVDLNKLIAEIVSDFEVQIQQTRGRIEIGELFTIDADPLQMRQLFQNLLSNALKFRRQEEPLIVRVFGERLTGDRCRISVSDNGIGFDEKYRDRIFQVFQRLHGRNEYEGTGIGLAICAKIVARHRGFIEAKSTPGQGATFIVTLPIRQAREAD